MKKIKAAKRIAAAMTTETSEFCAVSSTHGTCYLFGNRLNTLERLFWLSVVMAMLALSCYYVGQAIQSWNDNPTVTITNSVSDPVSDVQFPTITLCADFLPDRYGFVKSMLNRLKFQCKNDVDCADVYQSLTGSPKQNDFADVSAGGSSSPPPSNSALFANPYLSPYNAYYLVTFQNHSFFDSLLNMLNTTMTDSFKNQLVYSKSDLIAYNIINTWRTVVAGEDANPLDDYEFVPIYSTTKGTTTKAPVAPLPTNTPDWTVLQEALRQKLWARRDNYEIYRLLGINISNPLPDDFFPVSCAFQHKLNFDLPIDNVPWDWEKDRVMLAYLVLAMPPPGQFGTFYYNIVPHVSQPNDWFRNPNAYDDGMAEWYVNLMNDLAGAPGMDVTASELSAVLSPVLKYTTNQKYPRQFPTTVIFQTKPNMNQFFDTYNNVPDPDKALADFWSQPNYFGKLLGSHLLPVMEVMLHCQLRTRSINPDRYSRLSNLYGNIFDPPNRLNMRDYLSVSSYSLTVADDIPHLNWQEDYKANDKTPYYFLTVDILNDVDLATSCTGFTGNRSLHTLAAFQNDPDPMNRATYAGPEDPDETGSVTAQLRDTYQYQNMLAKCMGPGDGKACDFAPILTDAGICHVFNTNDFDSMIVSNTYTDMFSTIYEPSNGNSNSTILMNEKNGRSFQIILVLDSHQSKVLDTIMGTFRIGVNKAFGFMNVRDNAIEADVGYYTKIKLVPTRYTTTSAFKGLSLKDRKCRYQDEIPDNSSSIFDFYSYEACTFECRLNSSRATCGCTPWNYPQYGNEDIVEICDGENAYCFEKAMDAAVCSDCLPDCEDVTFTVSIDKYKLDYEKECDAPRNLDYGMSRRDIDLSLIVGEKIRHMDGEEFMFWYERLLQNDSMFAEDILANNRYFRYVDPRVSEMKCQELLANDFALVSIEVSVPVMTTLSRDVAIDLSTKIANIGGTLGVFTGMSIISMVEVVFLIYRLVAVAFRTVMGKKEISPPK